MTARRSRVGPRDDIALAIERGERGEWERLALYLLLGVSVAASKAPPGTVDDVLALFDAGEERPRRAGR
jgi:hypothetical protein